MDVVALPTNFLPLVGLKAPASTGGRTQGAQDPARVRKVSEQFEAMFLGMMVKSMRETVGKDKLTGGGRGEETFRSLLDQEYAQSAAKAGGIGIAKMLEKQLLPAQKLPVTPVKEAPDAD